MTTQKAFFSYEEVIDLHTESDRVSVIGLHTPTGDTPRKLCPGFFQQFRKFKYLGCDVTLVPAATLPADPLSVSYESAEPHIDPRDMLNPILFHGCHGNDLGNILNRIYSAGSATPSELSELLHSDSTDLWNLANTEDPVESWGGTNILESLYYRALTDKTWKKANIQRGFRKSGLRPRIYSLATNMQIQNATRLAGFETPAPWTGDENDDTAIPSWDFEDSTSNPVRYFTPRTVLLGWLDTRNIIGYQQAPDTLVPDAALDGVLNRIVGAATQYAELPRIFMGVILMPPAYKTEMYFRMIITHHFAFAGFRGVSLSNEMLDNPNVFDWNEKLSDGDSDDPQPEPEPEPEPDPDPTYVYPAVFLSNPVEGGYRTVEYVRSADDPIEPTRFTFTVGENGNHFSVSSTSGTPRYGKIVASWVATDGTYTGSSLGLYTNGADSVGLYRTGGTISANVVNAAGVIDAIASSLDDSEYFMAYRGQDLFNMFLTSNVYVADADSSEMTKWIPTPELSRS